jgi:hypothetical protein
MKEISLKTKAETLESQIAGAEPSKILYPSFSVYDKAPEELLNCDIGEELSAKVKLTSKDIHEGKHGRKSVGFDVLSIIVKEKTDKAREQGKKIAEEIIKHKGE